MDEETLQEVQEWFKKNGVTIDIEEFEQLCVANYNAHHTIETFDADNSLPELLDYFRWDLKNDLDAFFNHLEDLRIYENEDAIVESFIDAFAIDDHVARYLDEEAIVRDFIYGGGFQIGTLFCEI